jgi:DNA-binding NarL/FixJ family response regulator
MPNTSKTRILIADDHSIILSGIKMILSYKLKVYNVYECLNLNTLVLQIRENKPSHLILDVSFPEGSSLNILDEIILEFPELKIMIFTMHPKIMFDHILKKHVDLSFCEKKLAESEITNRLEKFIQSSEKAMVESKTKKSRLSKREQEVLKLILEGKNTQNIAKELLVKSNTISTVKNRIFEKLQVSNIVELIQLYN